MHASLAFLSTKLPHDCSTYWISVHARLSCKHFCQFNENEESTVVAIAAKAVNRFSSFRTNSLLASAPARIVVNNLKMAKGLYCTRKHYYACDINIL